MTEPLYTTDVLRLAASLQEPNELERQDGRAEMRSPTCGSRVIVAVQLDSDRRVQFLSQDVRACAFGQASAALVERHCKGLAHADVSEALLGVSRWLAQTDERYDSWPGLEVLEPARDRKARHGAILLPFRALLAALEDAE